MAWNLFRRGSHSGDLDFPTIDIKTYRQTDHKAFDNLIEPTREEALEYVPFFRCIDLLTKQAAELVATSLRIVNREGKLVDTEYSRHILKKLQEKPNEYQSGHEFFRDIMSDFLIDGNALIAINRSSMLESSGQHRVLSLTRLSSDTASVIMTDVAGDIGMVYQARPFGMAGLNQYGVSRIVHAKLMSPASDYSAGSSRHVFSESARSFLRKAIYIGKQADAWVGDFFDEGARNNMAISFPVDMSKEMRKKQIEAYNRTLTDTRAPLLLYGGATVQMLNPTPQDADAHKLREYGVQEIGRFYGVPAPLLGLHVTQWGSGIEQLARLQYRFSAKQHLNVMLAALSHRLLSDGQYFEIDSAQEVRGDTTAMAALAQAMRPQPNGPGVMSRKELRNAMGLHGDYNDDWDYDAQPKDDKMGIDNQSDQE